MVPVRLFIGHDEREAVGLSAFVASLLDHACRPVEMTVITAKMAAALGVGTDGTNAFTKSRFLMPHFCDFRGYAMWMDGADMLLRADVLGILEHIDSWFAVQVVKHDYTPRSDRKFIGTDMEAPNVAYAKKNWSSVMVMSCAHSACRQLTPEYVAKASGQDLHRFAWMADEARIGELPVEWNWLDEYGENPEARLVHYTNGIPGFQHYKHAPHSGEWWDALRRAQRGL